MCICVGKFSYNIGNAYKKPIRSSVSAFCFQMMLTPKKDVRKARRRNMTAVIATR